MPPAGSSTRRPYYAATEIRWRAGRRGGASRNFVATMTEAVRRLAEQAGRRGLAAWLKVVGGTFGAGNHLP
jgi:hypothetical protein